MSANSFGGRFLWHLDRALPGDRPSSTTALQEELLDVVSAKDVSEVRQHAAVCALGEMRSRAAVPHLVQLVTTPGGKRSEVKRAAAKSLAQIAGPEVVSRLRDIKQALRDESPLVRESVANLLGAVGGSVASECLLAAASKPRDALGGPRGDTDVDVRIAALRALDRLQVSVEDVVAAALLSSLDPHEDVRTVAQQILGQRCRELGDVEDVLTRLETGTTASEYVRIEGLIRSLRNESEFPTRLAALMDERGFDDPGLADLVGCAPQMLRRYRTGASAPTLGMAFRIARELGMTVEQVFNEDAEIRRSQARQKQARAARRAGVLQEKRSDPPSRALPIDDRAQWPSREAGATQFPAEGL